MCGTRPLIATILLLLLASTGSHAKDRLDSLVLSRVFSFQQQCAADTQGFTTNAYMKHYFATKRRNLSLWLVPGMNAIAKGEREYLTEAYGTLSYRDGTFTARRQVMTSTVPHNRRTMPTLVDFLSPNLYHPTIYADHILSPFCRENRHYYRYRCVMQNDGARVRLFFRPRFVKHTQLVSGSALVDVATGRVASATIDGEFDLFKFHVTATMQPDSMHPLLPLACVTDVDFNFVGNHITSHIDTYYELPTTLPDTVAAANPPALMDSLRPRPLADHERVLYQKLEQPAEAPDTATEPRKHNLVRDISWNIGDKLMSSFSAETGSTYVKLSPVINPQYLSYSRRKGFAYRMTLGARFKFNEHTSLEIAPWCGYNFKQRIFYFTLPLRLNYAPERDGHVELVYGNGNRISNSSVLDDIREQHGELPELEQQDLDLFDDHHLHLNNSIRLTRHVLLETGIMMHRRKAVNPAAIRQWGMPTVYRSIAPTVGVKYQASRWAPVFSIDYERGIKGKHSDLSYERWEADVSYSRQLHCRRAINLRAGGGFYSMREGDIFMDFTNFRDQNLPEGWSDDWSGNFQLLDSRLYNESRYYARLHGSYESPLLLASMLPFVGRLVEREAVYASTLLIEHHDPYSELGFGFSTRYVSLGFFAGFAGTKYCEFGTKVTFELFRRW